MKKKIVLITLTLVTALITVVAAGVFGTHVVYAQTATPPPANPANRGPHFGMTDQDLATALGITTDKLQAAYKAADAEALKQAVAKGLITQTQADQFSANSNGRHFGWPGKMMGANGSNGIDYNAILANALGISTDKLQAAYQQAYNTSLDNAVKSGSLTQQQADEIKGRQALAKDNVFQAAVKSAIEAAIKVAASSGVITQSQADAVINSLSANNQSSFGFGPGMMTPGGRGGFGGQGDFGGKHRGGNPGGSNNPSPTATPQT
jgi:hypothetical protein